MHVNINIARLVFQGDAPPRAVNLEAFASAVGTGHPHTRRIRVAADGSHIADGSTTPHVAVVDQSTGLMWSTTSIGKANGEGMSQDECAKACAALDLLGHRDWRLPARSELAALVDDTRHEPAIDTALFPGVKPRWHWTSTAAAWSSASAWGVVFGYGLVGYGHRNGDGFALAVRRPGQ